MGRNVLVVVNPATGEKIRSYESHPPAKAQAIVESAHVAQALWQKTTFASRARVLVSAARILRERADELAATMALEMGKPIRQGRQEAEKCAWVCEYYAEHGESFLASEPLSSDFAESYLAYRPLGVILAIMPWNFPLWQVFRFAAPALMAGNGAVLKHASNVPGIALEIEKMLVQAGLPENVFCTLLIGANEVSTIIAQPQIAAVTMTGSTAAGKAVASVAGRHLKKVVLELGGSDAYVVLQDAELESSVQACVDSRLINSGQSCIAAKRFIVHSDLYDAFVEGVVSKMRARTVGDPMKEETDIGPLARRELRDELHEQVLASVTKGARLLLGGKLPSGPGAYYPASVLVDVPKDCPAYNEELFGPVASVIRAKSEEDAIGIANDTSFGLGAAVFTRDKERGMHIAEERLDAGCCFVNAFVRSDPRLPFGGIKESGFGRELSHLGIREFVNAKTVVLGKPI